MDLKDPTPKNYELERLECIRALHRLIRYFGGRANTARIMNVERFNNNRRPFYLYSFYFNTS